VKVCKRTLVNEVLGLLLTEFFPDPTHKGYLLAEQCRRWAEIAPTSPAKVDFLDMERRWLSLAHNYEFSGLLLSLSRKRGKRQQK
jgi:hypothetical protein